MAAQAEALFSKGRLEEAETAIRGAIRTALNSPVKELQQNWQHYCMLGRIWTAQKRAHDAQSAFRHALTLAPPNCAPPHWLLGECLIRQGNLTEAEIELRSAIRLNPKASAFHSSLGSLLLKQCFYDDASVSLRTAIRLDRKNLEPRILLAELFSQRKNYRSAEKSLSKARSIAPRSVRVVMAMIKLFEDQEKTELAIAYARKLLEIDPHNASAYVRISEQHKKAGRIAEAREALLEACRLEPDNRAHKTRLKNLDAQRPKGEPVDAAPRLGTTERKSSGRENRLLAGVRSLWSNRKNV